MLIQCVRVEDFGGRTTLSRDRGIGRCDFCNEKVFYSRNNVREVRSKGMVPQLVCMFCYSHGAHLHQGYRSG